MSEKPYIFPAIRDGGELNGHQQGGIIGDVKQLQSADRERRAQSACLQCTVDRPKRAYTVNDVADMLDISRSSAYDLIKQGHFKTVRIGTAIRISKASFDKWLDTQD